MKDSTAFLAVLHVRGSAFDPDPVLDAHPGLRPYEVWRKGDPILGRHREQDAGFKIDVAAGQEWPGLVTRILSVLESLAPGLRVARRAGAALTLDIGVMPDPRSRFVVSAQFSAAHLATLARLGVQLCVSSYPSAWRRKEKARRTPRSTRD